MKRKKRRGPRWYIKAYQGDADIKQWIRAENIVEAIQAFQEDFPAAIVASAEREYDPDWQPY